MLKIFFQPGIHRPHIIICTCTVEAGHSVSYPTHSLFYYVYILIKVHSTFAQTYTYCVVYCFEWFISAYLLRAHVHNINMRMYITSAHGHELSGCVCAEAYNLIFALCIMLPGPVYTVYDS